MFFYYSISINLLLHILFKLAPDFSRSFILQNRTKLVQTYTTVA